MENVLKYNEYMGSVKFNHKDRIFHGKIEFIDDLVTFEGSSVDELIKAFEEAVEDYIEICETTGKEPQKSFKGTFNVRVSPELHRKAALISLERGISLNQFIEEALSKAVGS